MDFLKKNWSTLILLSLVATYGGISLGTNGCPLCLVLGGGSDESKANVVSAKKSGTKVNWQVTQLDGSPISSVSEQGKVSVLVYWATWCPPCRKEIPDLIALRNEFPRDDVSIIGISLDSPDKDLRRFLDSYGVNYNIARQSESLQKALGPIHYIPTMFILDRNGHVKHQHTGIVGKNVIHRQIRALLDSESHT